MASELTVVSDIPGRYATALFELARDQGALDGVAGDLESLARMIDESEDLTRLVRSPVIGAEAQAKAMAAIMAQAAASALVQNFVGLVAKNRRLFALRDMCTGYRRLLAAHRGEVVAEVTSAYPIDDSQLATIKAELSAAMKTDVNVETSVDDALIGGLVVRIGSRMIDSSLRTKLQNLRFAMKGAE